MRMLPVVIAVIVVLAVTGCDDRGARMETTGSDDREQLRQLLNDPDFNRKDRRVWARYGHG